MVNAGHKVRVRMTAELDDGEKINLGLDDNDEAEFTMGLGEFPSYAESLVARMAVGETTAWNTPAVRVLGLKALGRDIKYELTLLADCGRAVSSVAQEHVHHEHGCSCGCDRLRRSLAQV